MGWTIKRALFAVTVAGAVPAFWPATSSAQNEPPICATARRLRAVGNPNAARYEQACEAQRAAAARRQQPPPPPAQSNACQLAAKYRAEGRLNEFYAYDRLCKMGPNPLGQPAAPYRPAAAPAAPPAPPAAAPGPAAAAPAPARRPPVGQPTAAPVANDDWANNLPTVAAVKEAVHGADARETAARQEAAFATLCDYIEIRNGGMFKVMAPKVQATFLEYNREQSRTHPNMPRSVSPAAAHYFELREFREETLTKLISPVAFNAYAASSSYQALPTAQQRTEREAQAKEDAAFTRKIQADMKKAKPEHATLLGVPMGAPLDYPPCPQGVEPPNLTRVLGLEQLAEALGASQKVKTTGVACWYGPRADETLVFLQLPPWVVAPSEMNVNNRHLLGATLMVREIDDLFKQLKRKYGPPTSSETHTFQNNYGAKAERPEADWVLPGVHVHYTPQPGNMQIPVGTLRVELESVRQIRDKQQEEQEKKGPQL